MLDKFGFKSVHTLCCGGVDVGTSMVNDKRLPLISFTGSTAVGQKIAVDVAKRFGRTILELGGNNAAVIMEDADLDLALKACVFACVGTAGQRCTTMRRIFLHESVYDKFVEKMVAAYKTIQSGNPMQDGVLLGPLHTKDAVRQYKEGIETIKKQGGKILVGGNVQSKEGNYVEPTIVAISHDAAVVKHELFAPVTYVMKFKNIDEAI